MNISKKNQKKKIVLLPGEGSGPELIEQCRKVLDAVADRFGYTFEYCHGDLSVKDQTNAVADLPELTLEACTCSDAILAGPYKNGEAPASIVANRLGEHLKLYAAVYPIQLPGRFCHLSPLRRSVAKHMRLTVLSLLGKEQLLRPFGKNGLLPDSSPITIGVKAQEERKQELTAAISDGWKTTNYRNPQQVNAMLLTDPKKIGLLIADADEAVPILHQASVLLGNYDYPTVFVGPSQTVVQIGQDPREEWAGQDQAPPHPAINAVQLLLAQLGLTEGAEAVSKALQLLLEKGIGTAVLNPDIAYSCSQIGDLLAHLVEDVEEEILVQEDRISQRLSTII